MAPHTINPNVCMIIERELTTPMLDYRCSQRGDVYVAETIRRGVWKERRGVETAASTTAHVNANAFRGY